ncbi:hypothetical protein EJB05_33663, partial [Eragrostis curvula]
MAGATCAAPRPPAAYHYRERHARACAHAPYRCPDKNCLFLGSPAALLDHVAYAHGWPCTAEITTEGAFNVNLRDGFNFLTAVRGNHQFGILLNVARAPFGRAISAVRIRPHATAVSSSPAVCELELSYSLNSNDGDMCPSIHSQTSLFNVGCTDLSGGLRDPNVSFHFVIPKYVPGHNEDFIEVTASFAISNVPGHPTAS